VFNSSSSWTRLKNPRAEFPAKEYGNRLLEETAIGNLVSFYFGGWISKSVSDSGKSGGGTISNMFDDLSSGIATSE
jgi:hypothetical protein